jgi:hypothetical protein
MSEFPLKMSFFSSQQAAHIADISPTNQRNLRRHEYLPALDGKWARYSLDELCGIAAFGCLMRRGIPPQICKFHARRIAEHLADFAINCPAAVEGWAPKAANVFLRIGDDRSSAEEFYFESGAFPHRFFVVLGPKEAFTADALELHFDKLAADLSGCIVIDLKRLGAKIAARAARHLASVLPTEKNSENKKAAA